MPIEAIYEKLTTILRDVFDDDTLVAEKTLTADRVDGWDSFAHLRLMFAVESGFAVKFSASQIASFQNVGELAETIHSKLAG
jgi:acyl carrier protein